MKLRLRKAESDLHALLAYMIAEHGAPEDRLLDVTILHDAEHDKENARDPRAFCFVEKERPNFIHCAKAIEELTPEARVGVLYHEIGHILLNAFHGDESEVEVDEWCLTFLPMSNYTYRDTAYLVTGKVGKSDVAWGRIAKSLQSVAPGFVRVLEKYKHAYVRRRR